MLAYTAERVVCASDDEVYLPHGTGVFSSICTSFTNRIICINLLLFAERCSLAAAE